MILEKHSANVLFGEAQPNAKLTEKIVAEIRKSGETHAVLSARFSVNQSTISRIRSGQRWRRANF